MLALELASRTSEDWIEQATRHIDLVLLDHANCEKKAAGNALSLLFRYPANGRLVETLSPLAREELQHFERVHRHLQRLGIPIKPLSAAPYAGRLNQHLRRSEPEHLLDTLLVAAIIEARSHERLGLLGIHAPDPELRQFYLWLAAAEERHWQLYLDLALEQFPADQVQDRLDTLLQVEAEILSSLHPEPRVHS
ncbi:tRNA-(ms[2]io[6]A)-hydroxylase [Synechococcus sp. JA-2-3B'a(2-13)]|uniref:tRNA-(ms[2]io[6]A)-hydroxylase n=1 Tax=Synechococcus sp. (strain JA-2-3B'a(2-13)) TaxID=321332 RepID=UPI0000694EB4|nr:tRNA-(ms[2]io[6]A)-hydroxylase [Synechococcus sp. JA-2-3B'a(2-13)]ABD02377.1 tRNA-(MS[2]IO[6]A)-hydroxylase [Synechococcus sp. JA-2-3B'a(2-13)]